MGKWVTCSDLAQNLFLNVLRSRRIADAGDRRRGKRRAGKRENKNSGENGKKMKQEGKEEELLQQRRGEGGGGDPTAVPGKDFLRHFSSWGCCWKKGRRKKKRNKEVLMSKEWGEKWGGLGRRRKRGGQWLTESAKRKMEDWQTQE